MGIAMIIGGYITPFTVKYYGQSEAFVVYAILVGIAVILMYASQVFKGLDIKKNDALKNANTKIIVSSETKINTKSVDNKNLKNIV